MSAMDYKTAQRHLETSRLMGVDFLPISPMGAATIDDKQTRLDQLCITHELTCPHCTTATGYTQIVFGTGNPDASLMFIGEAPGMEEDVQGVPFVGAAGRKLDQIIQAMELKREDVYIANTLKSRPPNNRTPLPSEIADCGPFLKKQIQIIEPKVIVTLGSPATKYILDSEVGITKLRGSWATYKGIPVMPTYHPAYLLRNYTTQTRNQVWSDMQKVILLLFK